MLPAWLFVVIVLALLIGPGLLALLWVVDLVVRVKTHRLNAVEMMAHATEGVTHRDKSISAADTFDYGIEYGRWHQRAIDLAAPYLALFPVEAGKVEANGGLVFHAIVDATTVNPVHGKIRGIIAVRIVDLQNLAQRVQQMTMWSAVVTNTWKRPVYVTKPARLVPNESAPRDIPEPVTGVLQ